MAERLVEAEERILTSARRLFKLYAEVLQKYFENIQELLKSFCLFQLLCKSSFLKLLVAVWDRVLGCAK